MPLRGERNGWKFDGTLLNDNVNFILGFVRRQVEYFKTSVEVRKK